MSSYRFVQRFEALYGIEIRFDKPFIEIVLGRLGNQRIKARDGLEGPFRAGPKVGGSQEAACGYVVGHLGHRWLEQLDCLFEVAAMVRDLTAPPIHPFSRRSQPPGRIDRIV